MPRLMSGHGTRGSDLRRRVPSEIAPRRGVGQTVDDLPGPIGLPLIGNMHHFDPTRLHLVLEAWAASMGPIYGFGGLCALW